ncbi:MAG TPA: hypothetical protein VFF13_05515 [archaeon]|nr:hypothetical protein [archaeon]
MPPVKHREVHVHLGHIGGYGGIKLWTTALRNQDIMHIGIDRQKAPVRIKLDNLQHIHADFLRGLEQISDNSVHRITSGNTFGKFDSRGLGSDFSRDDKAYFAQTIQVAHKKLLLGGTFEIVAHKEAITVLRKIFENHMYRWSKMQVKDKGTKLIATK